MRMRLYKSLQHLRWMSASGFVLFLYQWISHDNWSNGSQTEGDLYRESTSWVSTSRYEGLPALRTTGNPQLTGNLTSFWTWIDSQKTAVHLYPPDISHSVLYALQKAVITDVRLFIQDDTSSYDHYTDFGSTHKWILSLEGGQKAVFKPKWYERNHTKELWLDGFEIHTSDIVSFHLDRILDFRRVPFTTGRKIHIRSEVLPVASKAVLKHLWKNGPEYCLRDKCYFCEDDVISCTSGGYMEGSVTYYVPELGPSNPNPWGPKYQGIHSRMGFNNQTHCRRVLDRAGFTINDNILLDLVDLSILDHLSYHFDSKLYFVEGEQAAGLMVYLDRGRSFTKFDGMDESNLLPLTVCCRIRRITWDTLKYLNMTSALTSQLRIYLSRDPLSPPPLLAEGHFVAMERRLRNIVQLVSTCISQSGEDTVVIP